MSNIIEEKIRLKIKSVQYDLDGLGTEILVSEDGSARPEVRRVNGPGAKNDPRENSMELESDGILRISDGRIELSYDETELTGMAGSTTAVSFDEANPGLVSMIREGTVNTVLIFEEGKRNICAYETEYFPFELCIHTYEVKNNLTRDGGTLCLDYIIEIHGNAAERTKFVLEARKI